jgi:hypothetical protein
VDSVSTSRQSSSESRRTGAPVVALDRWYMNTPELNLARPTLLCLVAQGDDIFLPVQLNGVGPAEYHRATVTRLEDDKPDRRIRMTVRFHSLDKTATNEVKPGDLVHRVVDGNDPQTLAYVPATDLWKWEGAMIDDPDGNGKVGIIRAERGPHPDDGHEIVAPVAEDRHPCAPPPQTETPASLPSEHPQQKAASDNDVGGGFFALLAPGEHIRAGMRQRHARRDPHLIAGVPRQPAKMEVLRQPHTTIGVEVTPARNHHRRADRRKGLVAFPPTWLPRLRGWGKIGSRLCGDPVSCAAPTQSRCL